MKFLLKVVAASWEFISVAVCSLLVGTGIGYLQGLVTFRGDLFLSLEGVAAGGMLGPITGLIIYYGFFRVWRRLLSLDLFALIVSLSAIVGIILGVCAALLGQGLALVLALVTPSVTIFLTLWFIDDSCHQKAPSIIGLATCFLVLGGGMGLVQSMFAFIRYSPDDNSRIGLATLGTALGISVLGTTLFMRSASNSPGFLRLCGVLTIATVVGSSASFAMSVLTEGTRGWFGLFAAPLAMFIAFRFGEPTMPNSKEP